MARGRNQMADPRLPVSAERAVPSRRARAAARRHPTGPGGTVLLSKVRISDDQDPGRPGPQVVIWSRAGRGPWTTSGSLSSVSVMSACRCCLRSAARFETWSNSTSAKRASRSCAADKTRPANSPRQSLSGSTSNAPRIRRRCAGAACTSSPCRPRSTPAGSPISALSAGRVRPSAGSWAGVRSWSIESTVYPGVTEEVCGPLLANGLGPGRGHRLQARLFAGADQSGRSRAPPGDDHQGRRRAKTRRRSSASPRVYGADRARRHSQGALDPGRRSRQGHREHPARSEHRADERACDHLRSARHPTRDVLAAAAHEMELPVVHARARRRPLHRRRPVLLDRAGRERRLSPGCHPRRPPHQRRHGRLYRAKASSSLIADAAARQEARGSAILGLTFKENVPDLRNSRVPDIVRELAEFGIRPLVHDPLADPTRRCANMAFGLSRSRGLPISTGWCSPSHTRRCLPACAMSGPRSCAATGSSSTSSRRSTERDFHPKSCIGACERARRPARRASSAI